MVRKADPNNRARVLQAACEIFNEQPFGSARMSAIAQRAGLAVGTVYLYFPSKEALVHGIVDDFVERMTAHIAPYFDDENFEQMIASVIHQALVFAQREQTVVQLVDLRNGLGYSAERLASEQQQLAVIVNILRQQMEDGVVYPYDPEVLAEMLRGLIEWVYKTALLWKYRDMTVYEGLAVRFIQRALIIHPSFDTYHSTERTRQSRESLRQEASGATDGPSLSHETL
jgi:AcrR family transcriptional regulator